MTLTVSPAACHHLVYLKASYYDCLKGDAFQAIPFHSRLGLRPFLAAESSHILVASKDPPYRIPDETPVRLKWGL